MTAFAGKPRMPRNLGENTLRNLGLVGVLVVLVVIGAATRPDLYGNASWVSPAQVPGTQRQPSGVLGGAIDL